MRFLPIALDVRGRLCLVAGGGRVGARKAQSLHRAGAAVLVVAPDATEEIVQMAAAGRIRWLPERYHSSHLDGVFLAVAATDDGTVNALLAREARERRVLLCDASSAERSEVIFGAIHEDNGLVVAVFTDGEDPSRSRRTRDRIAALLTEGEEPKEPC